MITSDSNETIGGLTLIGSGAVSVTAGAFQVNGGITFDANAGCAVYNPAVTLSAGTTLKFDSIGPTSGTACRSIVANGIAGSRVTITARNSTATARLGGNIAWTYTDVSNVATFLADEDLWGNHRFRWDVSHSTFTNVGAITGGCCGLSPGTYFRHAWNVHTNSAASEIFSSWYGNDNAALGTGTREIIGNVFDKSFSETFPLEFFTVVGDYFAEAGGFRTPAPGHPWTRFDGNLVRIGATAGSVGRMMVEGDFTKSILLVDADWDNQKPLSIWAAGGAMSLRDIVVDNSGSGGTADSGELWYIANPASNTTYGVYNTLMLCNMYGTSSYEIGAWADSPHSVAVLEHSLWCGGYTGSQATIAFPGLQMGEGYIPWSGQLASVKSNIFWHPESGSNVRPWAKMAQILNLNNPTIDMCAPANCDYNTGYGMGYHATEPSWTTLTGQAKGYVAKFSSPPGVHDVDVDPRFVDYKRAVPLFYTKYLGNSPAAWSGVASYTVGNIVSSTNPTIYFGLPVAYRYQNIGACAGQNPAPGSGAHWRDCWEWATLKWLRDNIATNTLFDDTTIGVSQQDAIAVVWAWIRAGYSPTNSLLAGAAHDGGDIGPMPVTFGIPGGGRGGAPSVDVIRGGQIRGDVIK
jgi:hypothetical protein